MKRQLTAIIEQAKAIVMYLCALNSISPARATPSRKRGKISGRPWSRFLSRSAEAAILRACPMCPMITS